MILQLLLIIFLLLFFVAADKIVVVGASVVPMNVAVEDVDVDTVAGKVVVGTAGMVAGVTVENIVDKDEAEGEAGVTWQ